MYNPFVWGLWVAHGYLLSCFAGYLATWREQLLNLLSVFVLQQKNFAGELHHECWASSSRHFYISGFGGQSA